jgi:hypothetical protein
VYREVQRAELAGLVTSRRAGNSRLVRAGTASLYYAGLADVRSGSFHETVTSRPMLRLAPGID